jgi:glycosyltransferase involved in cell wall biosynthesis
VPLLSIIVPVYNEINTIAEIIRRVESAQLPEGVEREIIIVDDCSTDGTRGLLKGLAGGHRLLYHEKNSGKGAAVRTGLAASAGDIVVIQDADMEYDPREYVNLLSPILNGQAEVVYGSRFMTGRPHAVVRFWHYVGNRFLTLLSNAFSNLYLTDMETCYKVFTRKVAEEIGPKLVSSGFEIEPEITARVAKAGYTVFEVGISYYGRSYAEGKKIGWRDGFRAIWAIIRFNLFA